MNRGLLIALVVGLLGLLPSGLAAQTLGEVAAREQKKKEGQKRPVRVYTEEDLKRAREAPNSGVTLLGPPAEESSSEPADNSPGAAKPETDEIGSKRQLWHSRGEAARGAIKVAEDRARELQARIDALATDTQPNPEDLLDPNRLQKREAQRQEAIKDLAQAKEELAAAKKAYEDLEAEARRQSVPLGWLEP